MNDLSKEQKSQERLYAFPYHYLADRKNGNFRQTRELFRGYEYISYIEFVLKLLDSIDFKTLLDVGCGDGRLLHELSKKTSEKKLHGIDFSKQSIALATGMNPGVHFITGSITDENLLNEHYDVITLIETLEHIPLDEMNDFLHGVSDHLSSDGSFIITVPSDNVPVRPKHYQHFNLASLTKTLEPNFAIKKYYFLNSTSFWVTVLEKLIGNRLFFLNEKHLLNALYGMYEKKLLVGNENNTKRLCVVCAKR